ncbi:MAG: cobalamin-dependent protein [Gammaproteobacteria bacterium]
MTKAIYLINPACDFPTYFGAEVYAANGFRPVTLMADLAVTTLAAMAPSNFEVQLCDQHLSPVNFDCAADFVGITGKITQWGHMMEIAQAFRQRGKVVVIGGPYASLCPAVVRPYCDILVRGEVEDIVEELFSDLRGGCWKTEYVGN